MLCHGQGNPYKTNSAWLRGHNAAKLGRPAEESCRHVGTSSAPHFIGKLCCAWWGYPCKCKWKTISSMIGWSIYIYMGTSRWEELTLRSPMTSTLYHLWERIQETATNFRARCLNYRSADTCHLAAPISVHYGQASFANAFGGVSFCWRMEDTTRISSIHARLPNDVDVRMG
jgi:hypothetical protein